MQGGRGVRIKPANAVGAFGSGQIEVVSQADVQRQLICDPPVVLDKTSYVPVLSGGRIVNFVSSPIARPTSADHESCHCIATTTRFLRSSVVVERIGASRDSGKEDVDAPQSSLSAKLEFVRALCTAQRTNEVVGFLSVLQVGPGLRAYRIVTAFGGITAVHANGRCGADTGVQDVTGQSEVFDWVEIREISR